MDFVVISAIAGFNNSLQKVKNASMGSDQFIMQRYIPSKKEAAILYRGLWKKGKGFKFYKLESNFPYNGKKHGRATA